MGSIIAFFDSEMEQPELYSWFHLLSLGVTALCSVLLCLLFRNPTEKTVRKILFLTSVIVIILEVYKQFNFSFSYEDGKVVFDYQWYAFPFQFCSTPMYIGLLASLIKNERIHKALCAYLATFALFAGTAVMFYPSTVFIRTIGINIQTMVCHGSMVAIGIFLYFSGYVKTKHKTILRAVPVFGIAVMLASLMNEIAHQSGLLSSETFNMFFISPYCDPSLPVFSLVQPLLPFFLDLIVYITGFSLAAYVMLLGAMGIKSLHQKIKRPQKVLVCTK